MVFTATTRGPSAVVERLAPPPTDCIALVPSSGRERALDSVLWPRLLFACSCTHITLTQGLKDCGAEKRLGNVTAVSSPAVSCLGYSLSLEFLYKLSHRLVRFYEKDLVGF